MSTIPPPYPLMKSTRGRRMAMWLLTIFLGAVLLDQASKTHVQNTLLINDFEKKDIRVFQGARYHIGSWGENTVQDGETALYFGLRFQYSRNPGAAFSMLADLDDVYRIPFFYGVTILAFIMIFYLLRSLPYENHLTRVGLAFIAAGAIGNFLDRILYGYVVDFIDVDWNLFGWYHDFAIFNVADICINIGIYLYIADFIVSWRKSKAIQKQQNKDALQADQNQITTNGT